MITSDFYIKKIIQISNC